MKNNLLKTGSTYGATVAHRPVFTRQGAINRYKLALEVAYHKFDTGASIFLNEVEEDMIRIGFTWDELEEIETGYLAGI